MPPDDKTRKVAQGISQTIDKEDDTVQIETPDANPPQGEPSEQTTAGYSPADLVKAPLRPPEPLKTEGPEATSNHRVVAIVGGAILLFLIGVLLIVFSYWLLGIILVIVAALLTLAAVFLPIR